MIVIRKPNRDLKWWWVGYQAECNECGQYICDEDSIQFENSEYLFCKPCVDKIYPRQTNTKIEYKEKIVEKPIYINKDGTPVNTSFVPDNKSKFD